MSGPLGGTPAFDSTTNWPVLASSLSDGATIAGGALVHFNTVYVNAGTVVARDATQPLTLPIALLNYFYSNPKPPEAVALTVEIHDPVLTFVRTGTTSATNGVIAGVLETQEAVDAAGAFGGQLGQCGNIFEFEIEGAQDILADGSNAPGVPCNAISIGLGFTAQVVGNPTQVGASPPVAPNPCAPLDAGVDGASDAQ